MTWSKTITLAEPLRDVRLLAGALPQNWQELLSQREEAAFARGRREGESALNQQLIQQRHEMAEIQRGILNSLQRAVPEVIEAAEDALIRLALEAAQKVVASLPINVELVEAVVREALQQVKDTSEVTVNLHPQDLEVLRQSRSPLLEGTPEIGSLKFAPSPEVTRGGCLVQTRFGLVDARREVKIEQLAQSLAL